MPVLDVWLSSARLTRLAMHAMTSAISRCCRSELSPGVFAYTALLAPPRDADVAAAPRQLELVRGAGLHKPRFSVLFTQNAWAGVACLVA